MKENEAGDGQAFSPLGLVQEHSLTSVALIGGTIESLLAGPVLPPQLDPSLIDRLPQTPGAYVLHGEHGRALVVGAACNLRLHILNYFRIDHATKRHLNIRIA